MAKIAMKSSSRGQIDRAIYQIVPKETPICKQSKLLGKRVVFKKNGKKISMSNLKTEIEFQLIKIQYLRGMIRQ